MADPLNVFLAGIIQGSLPDTVHDQGYRTEVARLIHEHLPEAVVYDPFAEHPDSLTYQPDRGRDVFFSLMDRAAQADILIAFLPEASMGTAIEMWNAHQHGKPVYTISPLAGNWVVEFLSERVFASLKTFAAFVAGGGLARDETA